MVTGYAAELKFRAIEEPQPGAKLRQIFNQYWRGLPALVPARRRRRQAVLRRGAAQAAHPYAGVGADL